MRVEMKVVFCVMVLLTGSPQAGGQSSDLPPDLLSYTGSSSSPDLRTEDPAGNEASGTVHPGTVASETVHSGTVHPGTVASETVHSGTVHSETVASGTVPSGTVHSETVASGTVPSGTVPSGTVHSGTAHPEKTTNAAHPTTKTVTSGSSVAPSGSRSLPESVQSAAPPLHTSAHRSSTAYASLTALPTTTGHHLTSTPPRGPAGPMHQELPSELNVGDDELRGHRSSSPLDPLLAGLLSVFIITTAVVFVVLFLKFRQRTNHPEFHRLQDLPMDDLMEDTPLSRYTY